MDKENLEEVVNEESTAQAQAEQADANVSAEAADEKAEQGEEQSTEDKPADGAVDETAKLQAELKDAQDKYLRLYSEFENFRRRTAKEKLAMQATASEGVMTVLLPILDDFERAEAQSGKQEDPAAIREGYALIKNKLAKNLEQKGLKPMEDAKGKVFDADLMEAITKIPAPSDDLKGKIVDTVEKGYYLGEKVIRFAKVVIGE